MPLTIATLSKQIPCSDFDCGDYDLNDFLRGDALLHQNAWLSVTRVLLDGTKILGFFTLTGDCLQRDRVNETDRIPGYSYLKYPAVKLARLAIDIHSQRHGFGTELMISCFDIAESIAELCGVRFLTVDAKKDAVGFYEGFGFKKVQSKASADIVPMYIDFYTFVHTAKNTHEG